MEDGVGKEDDTDSTTNEAEATLAVGIVEALIRCGVKPKQFLLLSGYHKQVLCKQEKLRLAGLSNIPVKSVDNSIAKTADFVILSLARTSQGPVIGFIREYDRLVVTLTRGRYLRHVLCERSFFLTEGEDYNIKHFCEWMDDKKKVPTHTESSGSPFPRAPERTVPPKAVQTAASTPQETLPARVRASLHFSAHGEPPALVLDPETLTSAQAATFQHFRAHDANDEDLE
jgi:hypothetical protein